MARACVSHLDFGGHEATLIDPLDFDLGGVFTPHFSFARGKAPAPLDDLAAMIEAADGYVMVSPEYNHSMSPALAHLLNHFGSSLFSYKPSVIATYSAGQWGGTRAAVHMRAFLSELGCLPVSAMIHVPKAQEVLDANGNFLSRADNTAWASYFSRSFLQLEWWAAAARQQRESDETDIRPRAFEKDPSQRNAPP